MRKVLGDLTDKGIATDENKVRHEMTRLLEESQNAGFDRIERDHWVKSTGWHRGISVRQQRKAVQPLQHRLIVSLNRTDVSI